MPPDDEGTPDRIVIEITDGTMVITGTPDRVIDDGDGGGGGGTTLHNALTDVSPDQHHAKSHTHDGADGSGTVDHDDLAGVSANDHHNQAHAIGGADHTGTLSHDVLADVSADDHHAKAHAHDGLDGSGTVSHDGLTGVSANDHHAEVHAIGGAAHSGTLSHDVLADVSVDDHHAQDHDHDGSPTQKLTQANTHESPDTDVAATSLHHTLGTSATQAAAGNHAHSGGLSLLEVDTSVSSFNNDAALKTLASISISQANWEASVLRLRVAGTFTNATGGNITFTWRLNWMGGGYVETSGNISSSATLRPWEVDFEIYTLADGTLRMSGLGWVGNANGERSFFQPGAGTNQAYVMSQSVVLGAQSGTKTLEFQTSLSAGGASMSYTKTYHRLERLA